MELAINNRQKLICHKTQTNKLYTMFKKKKKEKKERMKERMEGETFKEKKIKVKK